MHWGRLKWMLSCTIQTLFLSTAALIPPAAESFGNWQLMTESLSTDCPPPEKATSCKISCFPPGSSQYLVIGQSRNYTHTHIHITLLGINQGLFCNRFTAWLPLPYPLSFIFKRHTPVNFLHANLCFMGNLQHSPSHHILCQHSLYICCWLAMTEVPREEKKSLVFLFTPYLRNFQILDASQECELLKAPA